MESLVFLHQLHRRSRRGEMHYIMSDNASFHLKTEARTWAAQHRVRFYFTPSSDSCLNRIECHITAPRKFALNCRIGSATSRR